MCCAIKFPYPIYSDVTVIGVSLASPVKGQVIATKDGFVYIKDQQGVTHAINISQIFEVV